MNIHALTLLTIMLGSVAVAQEDFQPLGQAHKTLPFPASGITNIFFPGYQTKRDEQTQDVRLFIVKLSHRKDPTRVYAAQIGDYIGDYRLDRTSAPGKNMELYFVKSNATVIIRARGPSETDKNTVESPEPDVQ